MKQYKAYLLDFDGTLFDTLESLVSVYEQGFKVVGKHCSLEETAHFMHMSLSETAQELGLNPDETKRMIEATDEALDDPGSIKLIQIFLDVRPLLKELKKRKVMVGIVSGNMPTHIKMVLKRFRLENAFSFVIGADPSRQPKPSGDPIFAALAKMKGISPSEVVYVGDSLQDPLTAHNGGIDGILLERHQEYPDYRGVKIASLLDLLK
jgi:HAD superfamily hydrolase (TIGR01549 family)